MLTIPQLREDLTNKRRNLQTVLKACQSEEPKICAEVELQLPASMSLLFRSLRDRKLLGDSETVRKEMSDTISQLVAECCRKQLKRLGSLTLSLELPPIEVENASGTGYKTQYVEQLVTRSEERAPKGLFEHFSRLLDKNKKFYHMVNDTEQIPVGDNFKAFLDAQVENIRPEVKSHVTETIHYMVSACIHPLLECYEELDRQLETLTAELKQLRFAE